MREGYRGTAIDFFESIKFIGVVREEYFLKWRESCLRID